MVRGCENLTQRKFEVLIFSKNQDKVDELLHSFWNDEWDYIRKQSDGIAIYDGEHFRIKHFGRMPSESMRGYKVDLIYIDCCLVNDNPKEYFHYINCIAPCNLVPQRFPINPQLF